MFQLGREVSLLRRDQRLTIDIGTEKDESFEDEDRVIELSGAAASVYAAVEKMVADLGTRKQSDSQTALRVPRAVSRLGRHDYWYSSFCVRAFPIWHSQRSPALVQSPFPNVSETAPEHRAVVSAPGLAFPVAGIWNPGSAAPGAELCLVHTSKCVAVSCGGARATPRVAPYTSQST